MCMCVCLLVGVWVGVVDGGGYPILVTNFLITFWIFFFTKHAAFFEYIG